jgi:hypothetical protein
MAEPDIHPAISGALPPSPLSEQERAVLHAWRQGLLVPRRDEPRPRGGPSMMGVLGGMLALVVVIALLAVLLVLVALVNVATGATSGIGRAAGDAAGGVGRVVGSASQGLSDLTDPAHPPREGLAYDTELSALRAVRGGDRIAQSGEYVVTLAEVRRYGQSDDPRLGYYAVVRQAYREPKDRTVLGLVVGTDRGEAEYYAYTGESFRVGRTLYKVNWLSYDDQQVALATYRSADHFGGALKFEVE